MADTKISQLTELTTLAANDLFVAVDVSDTTMAPSGTDKKITSTNIAAYMNSVSNALPDVTITSTADWTAAVTAGKKFMKFTGNRTQISLGTVTVTDSLTIYLAPDAGFSGTQFIVNAGATLKIIQAKTAAISGGTPSGNGYIAATPPNGEAFVKGSGIFIHENISVALLNGSANCNLASCLQFGENPVIFTFGGINSGLNLSVPGSSVISPTIYAVAAGAPAYNLLVATAGTTVVSPIMVNTTGSSGILVSIEDGGLITALYAANTLGSGITVAVEVDGTLLGYDSDVNTSITFTGAGSYVSGAASKFPTKSANDNSTSVATTAYVDAAVAGAAITTPVSIANGGTNSSTALSNNRVMKSSSGAIVEAAAITANRALESDANGIPTHSATTATELGYLSGATSNIQNQLDALARVYVRFSATGGTITILSSKNVTSITRIGAGIYRINFTTSLGTDTYLVLPCGSEKNIGEPTNQTITTRCGPGDCTATTCTVGTIDQGQTAFIDVDSVSVQIF